MDAPDQFDTPRLHARPMGEGDAQIYLRLYTDPELMRHIAAPFTADAALRSFESALRKKIERTQRWILFDRQTGEAVGLLGLIGNGDRPEIGVMLLAPWHGRGLGTEAMTALVDYAFTAFGLHAICARQQVVDHPTVVRMMRRLGFNALPPTPERPQGGDWELVRKAPDGASSVEVADSVADR